METSNVKILTKEQPTYKKWEVFLGIMKIFGILLLLTSIIPLIELAIFLDNYWIEIQNHVYYLDIYGDVPAFIGLAKLISNTIQIIIPITIAGTIGKGLMYTKNKKLALYLVPIIAFVLFIIMVIVSEYVIRLVT